ARLGAALRDPVPGVPLAMLVRLQSEGTLAGGDEARIGLRLDAREQERTAPQPDPARLLEQLEPLAAAAEDDAGAADESSLARVHAVTDVHPWRSQPVQQLELAVRRLDAGAFHASAPRTLIDADATVQPAPGAADASWNLDMTLSNSRPGSLDEGQL